MQLESLVVLVFLLHGEGSKWDQSTVEAEIGSERDLGWSELQDAFSFHVYDSRTFQRRDNWCRAFRRNGHHSEPCAGGSGRKPQSLSVFLSHRSAAESCGRISEQGGGPSYVYKN